MKRISQRTLVRMMEVMEIMDRAAVEKPRSGDAFSSLAAAKKFWRRLLLENEFPAWFVAKADQGLDFPWDSVLVKLRDGTFFQPSDPLAGYVGFVVDLPTPEQVEFTGEILLQRLAALLASRPEGESVARSLELDGFSILEGKLELISLEGPVSQQEEEDRLSQLVRAAGLRSEAAILEHLCDAGDLYRAGKDHAALGESRTFLQAILDDVSLETDAHGGHPHALPGGTKNRIEYLAQVGFLTQDDQAALGSAWGMLSAGAHPGIPAREAARIGMILAIEFGQLLVIKFNNWKANAYRQFS